MPRCRDCKLFALEDVQSKSGAILANRVGRCLWVSTEKWPESVSESLNSRPWTSRMQPNDNHRCQRFIPRGDA